MDLVPLYALHTLLQPSVLAEARPSMQRDILLLTALIDAAEQAAAWWPGCQVQAMPTAATRPVARSVRSASAISAAPGPPGAG